MTLPKWCSNKWITGGSSRGGAKVCQFDHTPFREQNVARLDVSMDAIISMQVRQTLQRSRSIQNNSQKAPILYFCPSYYYYYFKNSTAAIAVLHTLLPPFIYIAITSRPYYDLQYTHLCLTGEIGYQVQQGK